MNPKGTGVTSEERYMCLYESVDRLLWEMYCTEGTIEGLWILILGTA